jgi:uncharacterized phage protein gp47/JayE
MSFGITPQGFVRKTYPDIIDGLRGKALLPDFLGPTTDISPLQPEGALLGLMAFAVDDLWQLVEHVYYALQLDMAEGVHLDRIVHLGNRSRKEASHAVVSLTFTGTAGSPITKLDRVKTLTGVQFEPLADVVIGATGSATVMGRALNAGYAGNVPASSIIQFVNPITGVNSVTNPSAAAGGRDIETDPELHLRFNEDETVAGSSAEAIEGVLNDTPGIFATVFENTGETVDASGIPPHCFEAVVLGGDDAQIAGIIFQHTPAGIRSHGNVTVVVTDSRGRNHDVKFSRAVDTQIFVTYEITPDGTWTGDQNAGIVARTIEHIGGFNSVTGTSHDGLGVGALINAYRLESLHAAVPGIKDIVAKISLAANPSSRDPIQLPGSQRSVTYNANIQITIL